MLKAGTEEGAFENGKQLIYVSVLFLFLDKIQFVHHQQDSTSQQCAIFLAVTLCTNIISYATANKLLIN